MKVIYTEEIFVLIKVRRGPGPRALAMRLMQFCLENDIQSTHGGYDNDYLRGYFTQADAVVVTSWLQEQGAVRRDQINHDIARPHETPRKRKTK